MSLPTIWIVGDWQAPDFADADRRFAGEEVPRPPRWGGYRVVPTTFEFWQGRPSRLHDRITYVQEDSGWRTRRLAP